MTHEVENSGDGRASQQSEVQTVTFNAGRGLGGTATLTYHDLYGQSWTTRPFAVGGDQTYRLEIAVVPGTSITAATTGTLTFTYGSGNTKTFQYHGTAAYGAANTATAGVLRESLLSLFEPYTSTATYNAIANKDRGNTISVTKHYSSTPAKIGGSIRASSRVIYDITIPVEMGGHADNGGLTALTVAKNANAADTSYVVSLYQMGDRSNDISNALTSLPNAVIPSVTVNKVAVTDSGTNDAGTNGNSYSQSYAITFNSESNAGDQNMLSCNAAPCDEDGCINRGPGVSEVRYMRHDPENHGEGINFVSQGYFIMDIGVEASVADLSAGSIKIMWDTGSGISSAIFAVVATASEVQTALRTITGWEGVTVELWGSLKGGSDASQHILKNHQFKVTFAAGYDDMGKSPTFYTMTTSDGAYADAGNVVAQLYDQRFSNSIWLGKTTGYFEARVDAVESMAHAHFSSVGGTTIDINIQPQSGDVYHFSRAHFGAGANSTTDEVTVAGDGAASGTFPWAATHGIDGDAASNIITGTILVQSTLEGALRHAYLYSSATSRQTSDYFAVGSTVEVLPSTWDDDDLDDTITGTNYNSNNLYRKFKVTGHVTNQFNTEFAKLDSFPTAEAKSQPVASTEMASLPDYNLKITSNNGTVRSYDSTATVVTVNEVQVLIMGTGAASQTATFKLSYKGEMSQDMDASSSEKQIAEEINGFSALSGPVEVDEELASNNARWTIKFDAADGDVAQLVAHASTGTASVVTRANGWSIEGPIGANLETMQAGGTINITAQEVCTFTVGDKTGSVLYFCYDGVCGSTTTTAGASPDDAINSIVDDNGNEILAGDSTTFSDTAPDHFAVTMPMGKSCDGLEMRAKTLGSITSIVKSVEKHNNGKVFKITRSFVQVEAADAKTGGTHTTTQATLAAGVGNSALAGVSTLIVSEPNSGAACPVKVTGTDYSFPVLRTVATATHTGNAPVLGISALASDTVTNCAYALRRYVITLDSMPTASATTVAKTLLYKSPVGSCNVAETTKGTFESYECSNRGACDGKSGLCACYEGYSGESCQTQTVLV